MVLSTAEDGARVRARASRHPTLSAELARPTVRDEALTYD